MRRPWLCLRTTVCALVLSVALAGCNALKLAYMQGPTLIYWWVDGYVSLTDGQKSRMREAVSEWFHWHRSQQLPEYVSLVQKAQAQALGPITPAAVCAWADEGRRRAGVALSQAVPSITTLMRTLTPDQILHIESKFAKVNKDFRNENLSPNRAERHKAAIKRIHDRVQMMYGKLGDAQRDWLAQSVASSPYDPERWYAERLARQQDILQALRTLQATPQMPQQDAQAQVSALAQRLLRSPRPDYRAYQERLADYNCAMLAQLHNTASEAQRRHAHDKLHGWEFDIRSLTALAGNG